MLGWVLMVVENEILWYNSKGNLKTGVSVPYFENTVTNAIKAFITATTALSLFTLILRYLDTVTICKMNEEIPASATLMTCVSSNIYTLYMCYDGFSL